MSNKKFRDGKRKPLFSDDVLRAIAWELEFTFSEEKILPYLVKDEKESAIAKGLGISPHTVHTHLNRLYAKLGVSSRVELTVLLVQEHQRHDL